MLAKETMKLSLEIIQIARLLSTAVLGIGKSTQLVFPRSFLEDAAESTGYLVEWSTLNVQHAKLLIQKNWGEWSLKMFVFEQLSSWLWRTVMFVTYDCVSNLDTICLRWALFAFLARSLCTEVHFSGPCPHWEQFP